MENSGDSKYLLIISYHSLAWKITRFPDMRLDCTKQKKFSLLYCNKYLQHLSSFPQRTMLAMSALTSTKSSRATFRDEEEICGRPICFLLIKLDAIGISWQRSFPPLLLIICLYLVSLSDLFMHDVRKKCLFVPSIMS